MYINFEYLFKKGLNELDIIPLQIIKQLRTEKERENNLAAVLDDERLGFYEQEGLITQIKGKKKDSELSKIRLTKKGNQLLEDIQTADIDEHDIVIFDWLKGIYRALEKQIGNGKRTKSGIAQFRKETGIEGNHLAFLIKAFVTDEDNMKYNNKLENVFFSSKNLYSRKFSIDDCRLYDYYQMNKEYLENKFSEIDHKNNK